MKRFKKKILLSIFIIPLLFIYVIAHAVTCFPTRDSTWVVEESCDFPSWDFQVYGDIEIWPHTINISSGVNLGIDLSQYKITFSTGKILLNGTAKIDNILGERYYRTLSYSQWSSIEWPTETYCPDGSKILNDSKTAFISGYVYVSNNWIMDCAKP